MPTRVHDDQELQHPRIPYVRASIHCNQHRSGGCHPFVYKSLVELRPIEEVVDLGQVQVEGEDRKLVDIGWRLRAGSSGHSVVSSAAHISRDHQRVACGVHRSAHRGGKSSSRAGGRSKCQCRGAGAAVVVGIGENAVGNAARCGHVPSDIAVRAAAAGRECRAVGVARAAAAISDDRRAETGIVSWL